MRDCWYGDKRDIVKWAVLISLAHHYKTKTILWVVFYTFERPKHKLKLGDHDEPIPPEVWKHFRDIGQISRLGPPAGVKIKVLNRPWKSKPKSERDACFGHVAEKISKGAREPMIVFLDPDTGLGRDKETKAKHVCPSELKTVFKAMRKRDRLVFYQHAQRRTDWQKTTRKSFAEAIDLSPKEDVRATAPYHRSGGAGWPRSERGWPQPAVSSRVYEMGSGQCTGVLTGCVTFLKRKTVGTQNKLIRAIHRKLSTNAQTLACWTSVW